MTTSAGLLCEYTTGRADAGKAGIGGGVWRSSHRQEAVSDTVAQWAAHETPSRREPLAAFCGSFADRQGRMAEDPLVWAPLPKKLVDPCPCGLLSPERRRTSCLNARVRTSRRMSEAWQRRVWLGPSAPHDLGRNGRDERLLMPPQRRPLSPPRRTATKPRRGTECSPDGASCAER